MNGCCDVVVEPLFARPVITIYYFFIIIIDCIS